MGEGARLDSPEWAAWLRLQWYPFLHTPAHIQIHVCARTHTHLPRSAIPHVGAAYNLASRAALKMRTLPEALASSVRPRVSGTGPGPQAFASAEKTPPCPPAWTCSPCHTCVPSIDVGTWTCPRLLPVGSLEPVPSPQVTPSGTVIASRPVCPLSSVLGVLSTHSPGLSTTPGIAGHRRA